MVESPGPDRENVGAGSAVLKPRKRTGRPGAGFAGWAFVSPTILVLLALTIFPLVFSLALSFSNVSQDNGLTFTDRTLDNWRNLIHNGDFWQSLIYTTEFVVLGVILEFLIGFGLALLLWRRIRFGGFFRVLFSIPMMLAPVAIGFMWRMLYDQINGPIDAILRGLHLSSVPWLAESGSAFLAVLIMDIWEWTPFMFLLLLAGLQSLSEEAIEAAQLDGATGVRIVWNIIFPMVAPIAVMAAFLRFTESFTIFGQIIQLTGGGPGTATTSTTLYAYFQGYQDFNVSSGATIALSLLIFVVVIATFYLAITRRLLLRFEE
jgi:multiple sugar transport system permease protein